MVESLRPKRGGFLRSVRCAVFIRDFLLGKRPYGSPKIDPEVGAPQADIFRFYKDTLRKTTAYDRATRFEERRARKEKRLIDPDNIEKLKEKYLARMPYKANGCRFHSFIVYFSNLQRLAWVEPTGQVEPSDFQDHYPKGQSRKYFRLTKAGKEASDAAWANPWKALYGNHKSTVSEGRYTDNN